MNNAIKLLLVLSLSATLLTGCNTARGVGEDIQGAGACDFACGQLSAFLPVLFATWPPHCTVSLTPSANSLLFS